ncbi:hypothetical protein [Idiomarina sp.]|uniref:hypothetical protein n=1 Tax=Idiomarina sp. TaxID=1874361 RepID=UPI002EB2BB7F|nr:hypothetical protein [Pseudomonadota bacterium]
MHRASMIRLVSLSMALSSLLLSACSPSTSSSTAQDNPIAQLDLKQLPNAEWRLSRAVIEVSFCRDRTNEALLASESELNGWRLTGDVSAFPPYREEGLKALYEVVGEQPFILYQVDGSVSASRYRLAMPASKSAGAVAEQVFPAVATLAGSERVCLSAVDEGATY